MDDFWGKKKLFLVQHPFSYELSQVKSWVLLRRQGWGGELVACFGSHTRDPETNSELVYTWKWMVGIWLAFLLGPGLFFRGENVSFREGNNSLKHDFWDLLDVPDGNSDSKHTMRWKRTIPTFRVIVTTGLKKRTFPKKWLFPLWQSDNKRSARWSSSWGNRYTAVRLQ